MLKLREATTTELGRWYSALETDFDRRELLPLGAIRKAVRREIRSSCCFMRNRPESRKAMLWSVRRMSTAMCC